MPFQCCNRLAYKFLQMLDGGRQEIMGREVGVSDPPVPPPPPTYLTLRHKLNRLLCM